MLSDLDVMQKIYVYKNAEGCKSKIQNNVDRKFVETVLITLNIRVQQKKLGLNQII